MVGLRCVLVPVGGSFSLMCNTEVSGLVEVGLSPVLDLFSSNQFTVISLDTVILF